MRLFGRLRTLKNLPVGNKGGGGLTCHNRLHCYIACASLFPLDGTMLVKCRKCGLIFDLTNKEHTLEGVLINHVNELQTMTCGAGGTHRLVGVLKHD